MKQVLAICLFAASTALVGCSDPQPTNLMENSDQAAIDAYEAAVAAQDLAADAEMTGDVDAADAAE